MEFKVGDVVRIKSLEQMYEEFGKDSFGGPAVRGSFVPAMHFLCGQIVTIKRIDFDGVYEAIRTEEGVESQNLSFADRWTLTFDMIEPYVEEDSPFGIDPASPEQLARFFS